MTFRYAYGQDKKIINLAHVREIRTRWAEDGKWRVVAIVNSSEWAIIAGPYDTKEEADLKVEWIAARLGAMTDFETR